MSIRISRSETGINKVHVSHTTPDPRYVWSDDALLREAVGQMTAYLEGTLREFRLPLDLRGTAFQRQVWNLLLAIPYGETRTYAEIAAAAGNPAATRAVGTANGSNPVAIIVPCHRVVRTGGGLGGYGGGLDVKRALLALEQRFAAPLFAAAPAS